MAKNFCCTSQKSAGRPLIPSRNSETLTDFVASNQITLYEAPLTHYFRLFARLAKRECDKSQNYSYVSQGSSSTWASKSGGLSLTKKVPLYLMPVLAVNSHLCTTSLLVEKLPVTIKQRIKGKFRNFTMDIDVPFNPFALLTPTLIIVPTPIAISIPRYRALYAAVHAHHEFCFMVFGPHFPARQWSDG